LFINFNQINNNMRSHTSASTKVIISQELPLVTLLAVQDKVFSNDTNDTSSLHKADRLNLNFSIATNTTISNLPSP